MTVSPFDHPLLSALLGDEETARAFSVGAEIAAMVAFERALAEAEAAEGVIAQAAALRSSRRWTRFTPDMAEAARRRGASDGIVVPELVRQLRAAVGEPHARARAFRRDQPGRHRYRAGASPEAGRRALRATGSAT